MNALLADRCRDDAYGQFLACDFRRKVINPERGPDYLFAEVLALQSNPAVLQAFLSVLQKEIESSVSLKRQMRGAAHDVTGGAK